MASAEVLLPSPRVNMLDSVTLTSVDNVALPSMCGGPHRGLRRPSGTAESESDSPPSKKSKKARRRRKKKPRQRASANGLRTKPVAPLNTTQFLMAEHDQLQDTDIVAARPRRHRDSSLSVDSEDQAYDEFYSSPEDEEEFLTREFWTAYEDVHAERLDTMTKAQLVQEYLALEEKVDLLERQLRASEISSLETENRRLREENFKLRRCSGGPEAAAPDTSVRPAAADTCAGEAARLLAPEARPDSGVASGGGDAPLPTQPSSFTTPPASPTLEDDPKTKGEVSASRSAEGGGVEAEVSSTTAT
ncbi:Protein HEXIM [Penaeus vannamei]|uniref:Protein HEXIM n=1 Tax=Penaeus vannamei TaxID=6689 RepID=A0A3R7QAE9_PENVA|nr:Protein HEXIM [Penaeus vannamei]